MSFVWDAARSTISFDVYVNFTKDLPHFIIGGFDMQTHDLPKVTKLVSGWNLVSLILITMFLLHSCNVSIYYNYLIMLTIFYCIDIELVITYYIF